VATTKEVESLKHLDGMEGVIDYDHFQLNMGAVSKIDPLSMREFKLIEEYEKFMADMLVIVIHDTTDKNASPYVPVGVNGQMLWLPRSRKIRIPRRFVERLAQSQETAYQTVRNPDISADEGMLTKHRTGQPYPFAVVFDPSKFGERWLARMMREGC